MSTQSRPSASGVLARRGKGAVRSAVYRSGMGHRRAGRDGGSLIIMFHGVGGDDLPVDAFGQVLRWVQRHFEVVPLAEQVDRLEAGHTPMRNCVSLTFDDGLKNNLTVAYPILQELALPATYFVCPGLIDAGARLWTHDARFRSAFVVEEHGSVGLAPLATWGWIEGRDPVGWMKELPIDRRREVEAWLADASSGFSLTAEQAEASELLSWEDLRSLDPELITIGSHSLHHPILPSLPDPEAEHEIVESAARLRAGLGRAIDFFCYPNGDHRPAHLEIVRGAYRAAVGVTPGRNVLGGDRADLFRVPVSARIRDLAWALHRASV